MDRKSGAHSVEAQDAWQFGDGSTLFGLEVRTPTIEEAQNMEENVRSAKFQSVKVDTPTLDQKLSTCVKTAGSEEQIRFKKLATCSSDKEPHSLAGSVKLQTPNGFEVLGADVIVDQQHHEVSLEKRRSQEPRENRELVHQGDKEALFEMQGHSIHADHAPPGSRKWTWRRDCERS